MSSPAETLPGIEDRARDAWAECLRLSRESCDHLLGCARALAEARGVTPPEAWGEWLKGVRIPCLAADRLLELHRVALDAQALDELGGIVLATLWAQDARLPAEGTVLAVTVGYWQPDRSVPVAYVWEAPDQPGHYCAGRINLSGPPEESRVTRGAMSVERDLWATVWHSWAIGSARCCSGLSAMPPWWSGSRHGGGRSSRRTRGQSIDPRKRNVRKSSSEATA